MNGFSTLWRREMTAFFYSPVAYVVMALFMALMGLSYWMLVQDATQAVDGVSVMRLFFGESLYYWAALLMVVPVITMRSFAEEQRSGTLEMLLTAPVGEAALVLAKYCGACTMFVLLWLPSLVYPFLLMQYATHDAVLQPGILISAYLGTFLIGFCFVSMGVFFSSLTRNQMLAAMATLAAMSVVLLIGWAPHMTWVPAVQETARYASPFLHMREFSRGVVDTRPLIFYVSVTSLFLYLSVKSVEARRWKS